MPNPPNPAEIRQTRIAARLTQTQSAKLCHLHVNTWHQYEAGLRAMHPAIWELYLRKCGENTPKTE